MPMSRSLGTIIPPKAMVKFKGADTWSLTNTTPGTSNWKQFYANNPFDPVVGASTTACSGFSQMMAFYARGICFATKVVLHWEQSTSEHTHMLYVKWWSSLETPANVSSDEMLENPRGRIRYRRTLPADHGRPEPIVRAFARTKVIENAKDLAPVYYAFTGAHGPSTTTYFTIGLQSPESNYTGPWSDRISAVVTYYCRLFDRLDVSA